MKYNIMLISDEKSQQEMKYNITFLSDENSQLEMKYNITFFSDEKSLVPRSNQHKRTSTRRVRKSMRSKRPAPSKNSLKEFHISFN